MIINKQFTCNTLKNSVVSESGHNFQFSMHEMPTPRRSTILATTCHCGTQPAIGADATSHLGMESFSEVESVCRCLGKQIQNQYTGDNQQNVTGCRSGTFRSRRPCRCMYRMPLNALVAVPVPLPLSPLAATKASIGVRTYAHNLHDCGHTN
jgi:hypothetical protein